MSVSLYISNLMLLTYLLTYLLLSYYCYCIRNIMSYGGRKDYNMFSIGIWMFFSSSFVDFVGFLKTFGPFTILCLVIGFMCGYL